MYCETVLANVQKIIKLILQKLILTNLKSIDVFISGVVLDKSMKGTAEILKFDFFIFELDLLLLQLLSLFEMLQN